MFKSHSCQKTKMKAPQTLPWFCAHYFIILLFMSRVLETVTSGWPLFFLVSLVLFSLLQCCLFPPLCWNLLHAGHQWSLTCQMYLFQWFFEIILLIWYCWILLPLTILCWFLWLYPYGFFFFISSYLLLGDLLSPLSILFSVLSSGFPWAPGPYHSTVFPWAMTAPPKDQLPIIY